MKKIVKTALTGELGVNLIHRVALEMNCLWHVRGGVEAGIDGTIEILDPLTDEATNQIITVQSKATLAFTGETADKVEFLCKERDLDYWMQGNTPIILVHSKPTTSEAYWVSIKDYFSDPKKRASRKITFSKHQDIFDKNARSALERLAIPRDAGLYLGLPPKTEDIHSDLVPVRDFPRRYYTAPAILNSGSEVTRHLRSIRSDFPRSWVFHGKIIFSFEPLDTPIWKNICDQGAIEGNDSEEWSRTDEPAMKRIFVELLNVTLRDQLFGQNVHYYARDDYFYERAEEDLSQKKTTYTSRTKRASKTVFKTYTAVIDGKTFSYCRHAAFAGRFLRFDYKWYLHIEPTYHFTVDGLKPSLAAGDKRSGIKRLEKNQAVHGNVLMWARRLQQQSTWTTKSKKIFFAEPLKFVSEVGFDDSMWSGGGDLDESLGESTQ